MTTVQKFKDLQVWQLAREFSQKVYPLTFSNPIAKDFRFKIQIRKARGSIMDNIAEGFERDSKREFIHSLTIAKGEVGELKSQLYRGRDNQYFMPTLFDELYKLADRLTKCLLPSSITYASRTFKQKFKERSLNNHKPPNH